MTDNSISHKIVAFVMRELQKEDKTGAVSRRIPKADLKKMMKEEGI